MGQIVDQQVAEVAGREGAGVVARRLRNIFSGSVGNLIEWYDFYIYNSFSIYFASQFSSSTDPTVQFLNIYGIYAIAFLIRPVGGILLGYYADMRGRRAALTLSVMLMCAASLMIAVIPTYGQIGVWAPVLLLVARLVQGLSLGGEYAASATYLSEISLSRRRGFYTSFQYVTLIGGQVLASLLLIVMQQKLTGAELQAWGWRVPFAIGAALALYGLYLRRNMLETEDFARAARTRTTSPLREVFRHPREMFLVFGLTMGGTAAFYTFSTYMPTFLTNTVKLSREDATLVSFGTLFFFAALQPALGALSDHIGRKPVLLWFGFMGTLCTYFIMTAMAATRDVLTVTLLLMTALAIVSGYTSINAVVKAELFPAGVRALGVGLPYAVAASVFGGSAPYVALWFKDQGHESWFFIYITALIFGSLLVYATMRETKTASLIAEPGAPGPTLRGVGTPGTDRVPAGLPAARRTRPLVLGGILMAACVGVAALLFSQRMGGAPEFAKAPAVAANPQPPAGAVPAALLPGTQAAAPGQDPVPPRPDVAALPSAPTSATPPGGAGPARPDVATLPAPQAPVSVPSGAGAVPQATQAAVAPSPPVTVAAPVPPQAPAGPGTDAPAAQAAVASNTASLPASPEATRALAAAPPDMVPDMIGLPGGAFRMGSNDDPVERPVHAVTVAPFLLAKHATTVREWQRCVDANACPAVSKGKPDDPITNVSWDDARAYAAWLSGVTRQPFRLPTEAEWEYAARAGTETRYPWGSALVPGKVSCKGCAGPVSLQLPPRVGAYPPNAFGFLAMGGGAAEWVADCWHRSYQGAPRDGSVAWDLPGCRERVLRGGSWMDEASAVRPASRQFYDVSVRYPTHGMRLARSK